MKKLIALLTAIALIAALACTPVFAEGTEIAEVGLTPEEEAGLDFENGNFEAVAFDGSVRAKIYVDNTWTSVEEGALPGTAVWLKENTEIVLDEDCDSCTVNLVCRMIDPAEYDGITTVEAMQEYLEGLEIGYECEIFTIHGIKALTFNGEGKYLLGACYELPEGLLYITVDGITNEELENEAVLILCSLITEE